MTTAEGGFRATVLTLYPEMFPGPLGVSLAGKALQDGAWSLETVQIRDFATDKHRMVDDTPAGGGAGMVMKAGCSGPRCGSCGGRAAETVHEPARQAAHVRHGCANLLPVRARSCFADVSKGWTNG